MSIYNTFSKIFGRSPFKPLQEHMNKVYETVALLDPFMRAVISKDWKSATKIQEDIISHENQADHLKHQIRVNLPESLLLPVSRGDILALLRAQDKIANCARDIAGLIVGRKMLIPQEIEAEYSEFLKKCILSSHMAKVAISELNEILESAFSNKETKIVEKKIHDIDDIEHETDEMQITIRHKIFEIENKFNPIDIMFLYKIIDWTGDLADKSQNVGNDLQLLIAK